jgi:hypothetical protein
MSIFFFFIFSSFEPSEEVAKCKEESYVQNSVFFSLYLLESFFQKALKAPPVKRARSFSFVFCDRAGEDA